MNHIYYHLILINHLNIIKIYFANMNTKIYSIIYDIKYIIYNKYIIYIIYIQIYSIINAYKANCLKILRRHIKLYFLIN